MNDFVVLETMPDYLRAQHRAANNFGIYPHNGSVRVVVPREFALQVIAEDDDKYAHIVRDATEEDLKDEGMV